MSALEANTADSAGEIVIERNVPIPMRDGTRLAADIFRPSAPGRYPVIVERTPYDRAKQVYAWAEYFARQGYVYVAQNVRGRYASQGEFAPFRDDGWGKNRDGYDTIEWAAAQPWSNGNVGMQGGSYSGYTQYATAPTRPPHLRTLLVRAGQSDLYRDVFYRGGAYHLYLMREWGLRAMALDPLEHESAPELAPLRDRLRADYAALERWLWHLPLGEFPPLEGIAGLGFYFDAMAHPEDGPYWREIDASLMATEVDTPILHVVGWYDVSLDSSLRCFKAIREQGRSAECRAGQRLVVGPWVHTLAQLGRRVVGELDFGPEAEIDVAAFRLGWYDRRLKGVGPQPSGEAPVRIFLMGANRWLDLLDWPPPDVDYQPLYLRAGSGPSDESLNCGGLSFSPPQGGEPPEAFSYDPADPVPSLLRYPLTGPHDHSSVEYRMLTYTSDVLKRDLTLVGPVKAMLYAASSAPDTDWVVRLCDVWPDGRSMSVCDGILRARYRNSLEREELMKPGEVYRFEVDLWATAQVFQAGHRLRVEVTSCDFPRYARNLNTGGVCAEETVGRVAMNHVFCDAKRASHLILPLFEPAKHF